ncbi:hypothetical protein SPSIL_008630 [Sporomusa silvacetica DSM 10669]|uniref:Uncharacterized protein n=1 Tax=Sporomusa silvacetica DSM 10669 TaxID=1123289 RepID=A0ABZ3IH54_9FIRM|nr:hypothetical protein SPSIL_56330 [Sporomusa silvacetica DSM 10669]
MNNDLDKAIETFLVNYISLCEQCTKNLKDGKPFDSEALATLNDSARVVASHIKPKERAITNTAKLDDSTINFETAHECAKNIDGAFQRFLNPNKKPTNVES